MKHDGFKKPKAKLHTVELFKKGFAFPQIALNDFATEQLENLKDAENKLSNNLNDNQALSEFMVTANVVAEKLKNKYKSQWTNPLQEKLEEPQTETAAADDPPLNSDKEPETQEPALKPSEEPQQPQPFEPSKSSSTSEGLPNYESFGEINVVNEDSRYAKDEEKAAMDFEESLE